MSACPAHIHEMDLPPLQLEYPCQCPPLVKYTPFISQLLHYLKGHTIPNPKRDEIDKYPLNVTRHFIKEHNETANNSLVKM